MKNVKQKDHEIIDLDYQPTSFYTLPNDTLAVAVYETKDFNMKKYLQIYDKEFKLVKKIEKINNETFSPRFLTSNGKDSIFITDVLDNQIIKTDLDFNFVKQFGSTGSTNHQLDCPNGISFHKNFIFVCDTNNHRIQKLTEDLVFEESYPLKLKPFNIQIVNNIACIEPTLGSVRLFNLDPFLCIRKIFSFAAPIAVFNSWFFIYTNESKSIQCYNLNGDLVEKKDMEIDENILENYPMVYFNKHLIIGTRETKKLIIF